MFTIKFVPPIAVLVLVLFTGCDKGSRTETIATDNPNRCSPYDGDDLTIVRVVDVELHIGIERETYYTFHYDESNPMHPRCISLSGGKLCKCDIKSQEIDGTVECSDGIPKAVTKFIFKTDALLHPGAACPDRE